MGVKNDNIMYAGPTRIYRADSITAFITSYSFPHTIISGQKMIRFIDPVYRCPTHGRFYYILFYPHIIILIETKNDNFIYQSYTHNRDCVSNRSWFAYARSGARGSLLVARCSFGCSPSFGARGYLRMFTCVSLQWVMS